MISFNGGNKMITISLCTQKGGVSKTTTAEALIMGLRRKGFKVLGLDLDQQGNLTKYFLKDGTYKHTAFDLVHGDFKPEDVIVNDIIPGGVDLMMLPQYFDLPTSSLLDLKRVLASVSGIYDVLVIDTPPAINKVVMAALAMSNYVIMPSEPSADSLQGIMNTTQACEAIIEQYNKDLHILGVLLTKFKERYKLHTQFRDYIIESKKYPLFKTVIRESQAINNAKVNRADFFSKEYMHANAVMDYRNFVKEVMDKVKLAPKA